MKRNITEGNWNCEGYYIDFKKITEDLNANDEDLIKKINDFKSGARHGLNIPGNLSDAIKGYISRTGNKELTKSVLIAYGFNLKVFYKYISPITDDFLQNLDFHKPFIDNVVFARNGSLEDKNLYVRVDDLVDVWFDSGAMPYAQWHYPFENKELVDSHKAFPADFICEGVDQTRGWFYTLHALGALLFDSVAYKTVVSNGLVLG
ncbi:MAG: class I tRNA ligase family protein [Segetibacter sp.]